MRKMRGLTAKLLGQKSEKTKPRDEHTPPESEHEPHRGSTKGPFMCTREDCWCLDGQLPNHRPGIDLAGASARLLEASFRQTLSKCIKTDGQTVGVTLFLGVDWKERGGSDVFPHEVAGELVRVLGGDEMAELVQAFGAERWNHREEEGTKKKMKKRDQSPRQPALACSGRGAHGSMERLVLAVPQRDQVAGQDEKRGGE